MKAIEGRETTLNVFFNLLKFFDCVDQTTQVHRSQTPGYLGSHLSGPSHILFKVRHMALILMRQGQGQPPNWGHRRVVHERMSLLAGVHFGQHKLYFQEAILQCLRNLKTV